MAGADPLPRRRLGLRRRLDGVPAPRRPDSPFWPGLDGAGRHGRLDPRRGRPLPVAGSPRVAAARGGPLLHHRLPADVGAGAGVAGDHRWCADRDRQLGGGAGAGVGGAGRPVGGRGGRCCRRRRGGARARRCLGGDRQQPGPSAAGRGGGRLRRHPGAERRNCLRSSDFHSGRSQRTRAAGPVGPRRCAPGPRPGVEPLRRAGPGAAGRRTGGGASPVGGDARHAAPHRRARAARSAAARRRRGAGRTRRARVAAVPHRGRAGGCGRCGGRQRQAARRRAGLAAGRGPTRRCDGDGAGRGTGRAAGTARAGRA